MKSLFGMSVIAPDLVLAVLGNGDSGKDANDGNCNQHLYECEAFCTFICWIFEYYYSLLSLDFINDMSSLVNL